MSMSEIIHRTIELARAPRPSCKGAKLLDPVQAQRRAITSAGEAIPRPSPARVALARFLESLAAAQTYWLTTIMYLGRGDFSTKNLRGQYTAMRNTFGTPEIAASQIMGKAHLARYLENGLQKLRAAAIDVERLFQ